MWIYSWTDYISNNHILIVLFYRSQTRVIASKSDVIELPSGYYEGVTVSTSLNPVGNVIYSLAHQHVNYAGVVTTSEQRTSGGCFTKAVSRHAEGWDETWNFEKGGPNHEWYSYDYTAYVCNCGYSQGEIVRTTTNQNDVQPNEYIKSVTITY